MQNHNMYRPIENYFEEDKLMNNGFASVIENDYLLDYLNDPDASQRKY